MKKILIIVFSVLTFAAQAQTDLATSIANDPAFSELVNISKTNLDILVKSTKGINLDKEKLLQQDVEYIASATNIPVTEINNIHNSFKLQVETLAKNYPSLTKLSHAEVKKVFEESYEILIPNNMAPDPCSDCKRKGKAAMVAGTVLGAASCSGGGLLGMWGCGVLGWWVAAEDTLACIKKECKN